MNITTPNHLFSPRYAIRLLVVIAAYFVTARLGLAIPYVGSHITLIWLPTGIAVAVLIRGGIKFWPGIFLGAMASNYSIDANLPLDMSIAIGSTLATLLSTYLLKRLKFLPSFERAYDILLLVISSAVGMLFSASGGVASLVLFNLLPIQDSASAWLSWWAGDFVGVLLAAPLLLNISTATLKKLVEKRIEFIVWVALILIVSWSVFILNNGTHNQPFPLVFIIFPLIVWSSMRFGVVGSSLGTIFPVSIATLALTLGKGPFYTHETHHGLILLWLFLSTLVLINLMVAALQAARNRANEALQQSEIQLRTIIDTEPECVELVAKDGTILQMNPAGLRMFGADTAAQIIGKKSFSVVATAHRHAFNILTQRVFEGESGSLEFEIIGLKGVRRWLETQAVPMRDTAGKITAMLGITHDITDRKQLELKTKILIQRQRALMKSSLEGIHIMDKYGNIVEANDAFCRMLGYTQEEVVKLNVSDWDARWTREELTVRFKELVQIDGALFESRHRRKDGSIIDVEISTTGTELDGSYFLYASSRDISLRKKNEEEQRIAAVAFDTQDGIMITDVDANIVRINQAFQDITGYSSEEVIGKNPRILHSGRHNADFYQAMWATLSNTGKWTGEIWDKRKNGEIYPKLMTITTVRDNQQSVTNYVAVFRDISNRKISEQAIHQLAFYDPLTKLPNRRLLLDRLHQAMSTSMRNGRFGALLFLDLDNFKIINDTQGHSTGDKLLIEVAQRLLECVREKDSLARLGGDEFVVVLEDLSSDSDEAGITTELVAEKIRMSLDRPYTLNELEFKSTVSIGVSLFRGHQESADGLLQHADVAMYQAKSGGRNAIRFFDPSMQTVLDIRTGMEADLRRALGKQQFRLLYQIQVDHKRKALGAEVLLRWEHPDRGIVSPMQFIPLAEETGLIVGIGLWVLYTACTQLKAWQSNPFTCNLTLAVNVSAKQLRHADFVSQVQGVLQETGARASHLKLELTESTVLDNVEDSINKMHEIKALGVSFSMDDFGTGYSSLQYLKRLPLKQIKIDQSFVRDIATNPNDAAIVQTIIAMTEALGLDVIAEGVETEAQLEFIELRGCNAFQGYLFGKPVPLAMFETMLADNIPTFAKQ